jgi:RNA-directed DNA polymerase
MWHRLRAVLLKQWKRGKTIDRELTGLGAKPTVARLVAQQRDAAQCRSDSGMG